MPPASELRHNGGGGRERNVYHERDVIIFYVAGDRSV